MDYTIDLTVTFSGCSPVECISITIIDDSLALEGNETFQFTIDPRPGIHVISPKTAEVTISENDLGTYAAIPKREEQLRYYVH